MTPSETWQRGAAFMLTHARTLERRLFDGSGDALAAYRNADGGYGHALEPDVRTATSQPIHVHFAASMMREEGLSGDTRIADYLAGVANAEGAIPYIRPDALEKPRAGHWNGDWCLTPSLHATAGIAGALHAIGVQHEWLDRATTWCFREIQAEPDYTGHCLLNVFELLDHAPGGTALWDRAAARLFEADHVLLQTPITTYGLTPLQFAPTPDSPARTLFSDDVIAAHLDYLAAQQGEDGGWPIAWTPPEGAAANAWRGRVTLVALRTLRAYGRA
ncbi:MAG: hypothetical protein ACYS0E_15285 [Planctomycetota bacterium]|jgi:hypothetical protein